MADIEKSGFLKYKDKSGNVYKMFPKTKSENVDGLNNLIDEAQIVDRSVSATSTDGKAYAATVPGITALTAGLSFIMIPNMVSTDVTCTLNVNGLGAKNLRIRGTGYTATTVSPSAANWLASGKPARVTYDGAFWIVEITAPSESSSSSDVLVVNISGTIDGYTDDGLTADKSFMEIGVAATNGQAVIANNNGTYVPLFCVLDDEYVQFSCYYPSAEDTPQEICCIDIVISSNNSIVAYSGGINDYLTVASAYMNEPIRATSTDGIAYTITNLSLSSALINGISFVMVPNRVSASVTCTLSANNSGTKPMRIRGVGYTATTASPTNPSWLSADKPVRVTYDGTFWVVDLINDVEEKYTYSTTDLTAGESALATGKLYFVYE